MKNIYTFATTVINSEIQWQLCTVNYLYIYIHTYIHIINPYLILWRILFPSVFFFLPKLQMAFSSLQHIPSISPYLLYLYPHHYRIFSIILSLSLHYTIQYMQDTTKTRQFIPEWLLMLGTPPESSTQYPAQFPAQTGTVTLCWSL